MGWDAVVKEMSDKDKGEGKRERDRGFVLERQKSTSG